MYISFVYLYFWINIKYKTSIALRHFEYFFILLKAILIDTFNTRMLKFYSWWLALWICL